MKLCYAVDLSKRRRVDRTVTGNDSDTLCGGDGRAVNTYPASRSRRYAMQCRALHKDM